VAALVHRDHVVPGCGEAASDAVPEPRVGGEAVHEQERPALPAVGAAQRHPQAGQRDVGVDEVGEHAGHDAAVRATSSTTRATSSEVASGSVQAPSPRMSRDTSCTITW